jgi:hypothetical protein
MGNLTIDAPSEVRIIHERTSTVLNTIADHLSALSVAVRELAEEGSTPPRSATPSEQRQDVPLSVDANKAVAKAKALHPLLGSHQELIIRALADAHPEGLSAPQINPNTSTQPNTYMTCDKLDVLGLIRCDTNTHPKRYYLGPRMFK